LYLYFLTKLIERFTILFFLGKKTPSTKTKKKRYKKDEERVGEEYSKEKSIKTEGHTRHPCGGRTK
jgi:hypothetical protein